MSTQPARRLAVVSSSRADLAHLIHPLRALEADAGIELTVVAFGAMLQEEYGRGVGRLIKEGFRVERVEVPLEIETGGDAGRAIGAATSGFTDRLEALRPDLLMVVADRFEMLAPACAALALRLPLVHVEGGERSEGAIDDAVRNALTKLAHLHLVTTDQARRRLLAMGEEPWRIHRVGAASLDHLRLSPIPTRAELEAELGLEPGASILLVGMHPVTLEEDPVADTRAVLEALRERDHPGEQPVFCFPNADEGGREVRALVEAFVAEEPRARLFTNLRPETWFGLLHAASLFVGNSSSVVMESPSIPLPAVCVGARQAGRERAVNVVDAPPRGDAILEAMEEAVGRRLADVRSPYGDGHAAERILSAILEAPDRNTLLRKRTTILAEDVRTSHDDGTNH